MARRFGRAVRARMELLFGCAFLRQIFEDCGSVGLLRLFALLNGSIEVAGGSCGHANARATQQKALRLRCFLGRPRGSRALLCPPAGRPDGGRPEAGLADLQQLAEAHAGPVDQHPGGPRGAVHAEPGVDADLIGPAGDHVASRQAPELSRLRGRRAPDSDHGGNDLVVPDVVRRSDGLLRPVRVLYSVLLGRLRNSDLVGVRLLLSVVTQWQIVLFEGPHVEQVHSLT
mmetsp:Transcript_62684/g.125619  ORF Transcript_62684/g.125619 Transcript_62684/m.125619 type:complete len:229 (+) Transcript_62684:387-1073(+)